MINYFDPRNYEFKKTPNKHNKKFGRNPKIVDEVRTKQKLNNKILLKKFEDK